MVTIREVEAKEKKTKRNFEVNTRTSVSVSASAAVVVDDAVIVFVTIDLFACSLTYQRKKICVSYIYHHLTD